MLAIPREKVNIHESCRFCTWLKEWEKWKTCEGEERCIEVTDNDDFVAVLEKYPRIDGEILVISKKHVDDVSDIAKFTDNERINLCKILGETISLMKKNLKAEKVYLYSFCEHWEKEEIDYDDKLTTEHLHFHLLPRYRGMRHKQLAAEKVFSIPSKELSKSMLRALKDEVLGKSQ
jgi:diadenosine tetraphosphate (Ap4A) HIT family hydrolase